MKPNGRRALSIGILNRPGQSKAPGTGLCLCPNRYKRNQRHPQLYSLAKTADIRTLLQRLVIYGNGAVAEIVVLR